MTDSATFWVALAGAVLGAASIVLHVVAPRTKNTVDDRVLQLVDQVLGVVRPPAPQPSKPPTGPLGPIAVLALVVLGLAGSSSCATVRQHGAAGLGAFLDCEAEELPADTLDDATTLAIHGLERLIAGSGAVDASKLKADMSSLRTPLAKCAERAAIAALTGEAPSSSPGVAIAALTGPLVDAPQLRAAFTQVRTELGWAPVKVAGGPPL